MSIVGKKKTAKMYKNSFVEVVCCYSISTIKKNVFDLSCIVSMNHRLMRFGIL